MSYLQSELPSIAITAHDIDRLTAIADGNATRFPQVAEFLANEIARADVIPTQRALPGLVRMGSKVTYRDESTGQQRTVILVYPHEANIDMGRISVVTAVGAALIGLSVGQSIEFKTPSGERRLLTVLDVVNSDL
jgi:regulator of nucleoside diphosphate kinase